MRERSAEPTRRGPGRPVPPRARSSRRVTSGTYQAKPTDTKRDHATLPATDRRAACERHQRCDETEPWHLRCGERNGPPLSTRERASSRAVVTCARCGPAPRVATLDTWTMTWPKSLGVLLLDTLDGQSPPTRPIGAATRQRNSSASSLRTGSTQRVCGSSAHEAVSDAPARVLRGLTNTALCSCAARSSST